MKIINVVGARPNFMKIAPIQREMQKYGDIEPILIHTGQHYDEKMSKVFFEELELPQPDAHLGVGSASHAVQTATVMVAFESVLTEFRPDLVLVVGDVNSTVACSIVAAKLQIPIAHVEAGLRSFDRRMAEEINRLVTDVLADVLFVTEQSGLDNLQREGIASDKIHFVGNVMIDSLLYYQKVVNQSLILKKLKIQPAQYALITLHRPSNVDNESALAKILDAFATIEKELPLIFPIHPRTRKRIEEFGFRSKVEAMTNLYLTDPFGYLDFLKLMQHAKLVLTDSGGIQEETTYLKIPCLTLRENTERPVTIMQGTNKLVDLTTEVIVDAVQKILNGETKQGEIPQLWDGCAAQRIVEILHKF